MKFCFLLILGYYCINLLDIVIRFIKVLVCVLYKKVGEFKFLNFIKIYNKCWISLVNFFFKINLLIMWNFVVILKDFVR